MELDKFHKSPKFENLKKKERKNIPKKYASILKNSMVVLVRFQNFVFGNMTLYDCSSL